MAAAQGLASSWERAEPWQSCCPEAAEPWSCSSSSSVAGTAGLQLLCCQLQVQALLGAARRGSSQSSSVPGAAFPSLCSPMGWDSASLDPGPHWGILYSPLSLFSSLSVQENPGTVQG